MRKLCSITRSCVLLLLLVLLFSGSTNLLEAALSVDEWQLVNSLSSDRIMSRIEYLCKEEFSGRRAGSPEHYSVVDYLSSEFQSIGLSEIKASGFQGYKQPFTMRYSLIKSRNEVKAVLSYDGKNAARVVSFPYKRYNGNGGLDLRSEVVFVGNGGIASPTNHGDFSRLDVSGKIVMFLGDSGVGHTTFRKILGAYHAGAVACLICNDDSSGQNSMVNVGIPSPIPDFPVIVTDTKVASAVLGHDPKQVAGVTHSPTVRLQVTLVCDPNRITYNVVGIIPGADPTVSDQVVIVGAHYDHIGTDEKGRVFPGADDNASGVGVMLEVAHVMSRSNLKPRRTIVFAAWSGEEGGLLGSNFFVSNCPFPLESIVSSIQIDMVGTGTPRRIIATGATYPNHWNFLSSSAKDLGIHLESSTSPGVSDHLAFNRKKIPCSLIYMAGDHPFHHTVYDVPSAINPKALESAASLALLSVWRAANL